MPPLSDLILICLFFCIGIGISVLAYMNIKTTSIEIRDDGISFNSWRRNIHASWDHVREIRLRGRINKIYTSDGNFTLGYLLEPESEPCKGYIRTIRIQGKYLYELTEEIRKQAPNAKVTYAPFVRPSK